MKFTVVLRSDRPDESGQCPVRIRIADKRKTPAYITIEQVRVEPGNWNEKAGEVYQSVKDAAKLNRMIAAKLAEVKDEYLERVSNKRGASSRSLIEAVKSEGDFYYYFEKEIKAARKRGALSRADVNQQSLNVMKLWRTTWPVSDLTPDSIADLAEFLKRRGNTRNTIVDKISRIRTAVNKHLKKSLPEDPFEDFSFSLQKTRPKGLSPDEIQRMRELELIPGKQMWHARNLFLLSLNIHGMRRGDILSLKWSEVAGRAQYSMRKTKAPMDIKLTAEAREILALYPRTGKYVFPFLENCKTEDEIYKRIKLVGKNINNSLAIIGKRIRASTKPTLHVSRHSFTKLARVAKVDIWTQKDMLGHAKVTTTQSYGESLDNTEADEATDKIFGK